MFGRKQSFEKKEKEMRNSISAEKQMFIDAVSPTSIHLNAVEDKLRDSIQAYVLAIYSQNPGMLPMGVMTEDFYTRSLNIIDISRRSCVMRASSVIVPKMDLISYDNSIAAVSELTFEVIYEVRALAGDGVKMNDFEESRLCRIKFLQDLRSESGWLIKDYEDLGAVQ